jgi:hypothetical protein
MSRSISRRLYRRLLDMHPEPFRREFGAEMLEIFEACSADRGVLFVIGDALLSAARQQVRYQATPAPKASFLYSEVALSPSLAPMLASAVLVLILAASAGMEPERPKSHEFQITYAKPHVVLYLACSRGCGAP